MKIVFALLMSLNLWAGETSTVNSKAVGGESEKACFEAYDHP